MESEIRSSRDFVQMRAEMQVAQVLYTHTHTHASYILYILHMSYLYIYQSSARDFVQIRAEMQVAQV